MIQNGQKQIISHLSGRTRWIILIALISRRNVTLGFHQSLRYTEYSFCSSSCCSTSVLHQMTNAAFDSSGYKDIMGSSNGDHAVTINDGTKIDHYHFIDDAISDVLNGNMVDHEDEEDILPSNVIYDQVELGFDWESIHAILTDEESKFNVMKSFHDKKELEVFSMNTLVAIANCCENHLFDFNAKKENLPSAIKGLLTLSQFERGIEDSYVAVATLISLNMLESSIRVLTEKEHGRAPLLKDMIEMIGNKVPCERDDYENKLASGKCDEIQYSLLAATLRSLLLPNVGINLRNLLWHGFLGKIHRRWLAICIVLTMTINQTSQVLDDGSENRELCVDGELFNTLSNLKRMRECDLLNQILDRGLSISSCPKQLEALRNELVLSQFIPPTHEEMVNLVLNHSFLQSYPLISAAVMGLLIEHGLRLWWCDANDVEETVAKPGSYYVTLDGNSQRDKHDVTIHPYLTDGSKNKLVYKLGGSTMALLADLFASPPGGPNIRASIAHGLYDLVLHEEVASMSFCGPDCSIIHSVTVKDMASALVFVLSALSEKRLQDGESKTEPLSRYVPQFSYSVSLVDAVKNAIHSIENFHMLMESHERISNAVENTMDKKQVEVTATLTKLKDKCNSINLHLNKSILTDFASEARDTDNWTNEDTFQETQTNKVAGNCGASIMLLNEVSKGLQSSHDELQQAILDCNENKSNSSRRRKQIVRIFSMAPVTYSFYNLCISCALLYIQKKIPTKEIEYNSVISDETILKAVKRSRMVASTFYTSTNNDRAIKSIHEYLAGKSIKEIMNIAQ